MNDFQTKYRKVKNERRVKVLPKTEIRSERNFFFRLKVEQKIWRKWESWMDPVSSTSAKTTAKKKYWVKNVKKWTQSCFWFF